MKFNRLAVVTSFLLSNVGISYASLGAKFHGRSTRAQLESRNDGRGLYIPAESDTFNTWTSPNGATVRYKTPGKDGICETTLGVNSYSGFIDLSPTVHVFFWFFDSRRDPPNDDFTIWLNGGPGSDSLEGLFAELGPCRVTEDLETVINPYSFNNISNLLFLSQPVGAGFSYQETALGSIGNHTNIFLNASQATPNGVYPVLIPDDKGTIDTTDLAAVAAWELIQTFLQSLPHLQGNKERTARPFNLWTASYGGHYGPTFFHHFQEKSANLTSSEGVPMTFNSLGIFNGMIDESIQAPWYPEFAVNNTYGIKAINDSVYQYEVYATHMRNGCLNQIQNCIAAASDLIGGYVGGRITTIATSNPVVDVLCTEAANMCRDNVEGPYYHVPNPHSTYDIRHLQEDPTPPAIFAKYLNQPSIRSALGVSTNYSRTSSTYYAFQSTGDFIYPNFLLDLEDVIDSGVRVALIYGDADYICNWFGGQAISLALNFTHSVQFAAQGYTPFMYGTTEYGETREYGNFSFTRMYEAGHEVAFYQPEAAFAAFARAVAGLDMPLGMSKITPTLGSNGTASATHTNSYVSLPPTNSAAMAAYSSSQFAYYQSVDNQPPPGSPTAVTTSV